MAIHPSAIIDPKAELDPSVEVGPFCVIEGHVRVAAGCRLYHRVYLTGWTHIEENCVLHPGVIVGHEPQDTKYSGERTFCRIGRETILREYVTVHRGSEPDSETVVGKQCFLLAGSHVGHNCSVGDGVTIVNNSLLGGHVQVGNGATLGGATGVHQFVRVGELAMIAGYARLGMDVVPFAMTDTRGRIIGLNRIGLRRAGVSREHAAEIRGIFRILFATGLTHQQAMNELENQSFSPPAARLIHFLNQDSKRGISGRAGTKKVFESSKDDGE